MFLQLQAGWRSKSHRTCHMIQSAIVGAGVSSAPWGLQPEALNHTFDVRLAYNKMTKCIIVSGYVYTAPRPLTQW